VLAQCHGLAQSATKNHTVLTHSSPLVGWGRKEGKVQVVGWDKDSLTEQQ